MHREIFVELQYYFRARRPDPVIVDGGSNIGMSVLFFKALYPDARVLAFEPASAAQSCCCEMSRRTASRSVEIHRARSGGQNGMVPFFEDPDDPATFRMSTRPSEIAGDLGRQ